MRVCSEVYIVLRRRRKPEENADQRQKFPLWMETYYEERIML